MMALMRYLNPNNTPKYLHTSDSNRLLAELPSTSSMVWMAASYSFLWYRAFPSPSPVCSSGNKEEVVSLSLHPPEHSPSSVIFLWVLFEVETVLRLSVMRLMMLWLQLCVEMCEGWGPEQDCCCRLNITQVRRRRAVSRYLVS